MEKSHQHRASDQQWILVGGPNHGESRFASTEMRELRVVNNGSEHSYRGHVCLLDGRRYMVGMHSDVDNHAIAARDAQALIREKSISPIAG